jgi:hypothetical protein
MKPSASIQQLFKAGVFQLTAATIGIGPVV